MFTRVSYKSAKEELKNFLLSSKYEAFNLISNPLFINKSPDSDLLKFLRALFNLQDFGAEKFFLENKSSYLTENYDFSKHSFIIIEKFSSSDFKLIEKIKDFNNIPYIPVIIFVESFDKNNIDGIYDAGADFVFEKTMFFSDFNPAKPDYHNITYFIRAIHNILLKSLILKWFWEVSQSIINNLNAYYDSKLKVISNDNIRLRITDKLKIGFGHLRKPYSSYDSNFDMTNEEFAFLTYWSILNEYIEDWIKKYVGKNKENHKNKENDSKYIELKNGKKFLINSQNNPTLDKDTFLLKSVLITPEEYPQYKNLIQKRFKYFKFIPTYDITNSVILEQNNKFFFEKQPRVLIPAILLANNITELDKRIILYNLNQVRNKLPFTHSDSKAEKIQENFELSYYDCVEMINFLHFLLNPEWKFYPEKNIKNNIKRLNKLKLLEKGNVLMRFIGKIIEINPEDFTDKALIIETLEDSPKQIRFRQDFKKNILNGLKPGDIVEIYATVNSKIGDMFSQFIYLDDIIKLEANDY